MFRFENPIYLYLLVLIPILALIRFYVISKRRKKLKKFGDPELLKALMPDVSRFRPEVKFWLLMAAGPPTDGNKDITREAQRHRGHDSRGYQQLDEG